MKLQWSLLTIVLLMAAVASWASYVRLTKETRRLQEENAALELFDPQLRLIDDTQYALVKLPPEWHEDHQCEVYLPPGAEYRMYLATRGVHLSTSMKDFPKAAAKTSVQPGRFRVKWEHSKLENNEHLIVVRRDGEELLRLRETEDWSESDGRAGVRTGDARRTLQHSTKKPLVILQEKNNVKTPTGSTSTNKPGNGTMIWIERS